MALEISYADKKIRNICDSEAVALRRLPPNVVKALMHRLTDLNSASNIMDFINNEITNQELIGNFIRHSNTLRKVTCSDFALI
jgi:plasmid maintenance system killer protein